MTGRKVETQPVDQAVRRSCHANTCGELTVPSRHSWMCSWVRTGAAGPSYRLDEESVFQCLQLECTMLANPLLLSLGSQLRGIAGAEWIGRIFFKYEFIHN